MERHLAQPRYREGGLGPASVNKVTDLLILHGRPNPLLGVDGEEGEGEGSGKTGGRGI